MKYKFYDKDKKPFLVEANTKRDAIEKLLSRKKPNYRFGIWNKQEKKFEKNPETNTALFFEYPIQAENYIYRNLRNSSIFSVVSRFDKGGKNE